MLAHRRGQVGEDDALRGQVLAQMRGQRPRVALHHQAGVLLLRGEGVG